MGRDGLVGIAIVCRMESRCARDITHVSRPARGRTQTNLQNITRNFRLRTLELTAHYHLAPRSKKKKTTPVLPIWHVRR